MEHGLEIYIGIIFSIFLTGLLGLALWNLILLTKNSPNSLCEHKFTKWELSPLGLTQKCQCTKCNFVVEKYV